MVDRFNCPVEICPFFLNCQSRWLGNRVDFYACFFQVALVFAPSEIHPMLRNWTERVASWFPTVQIKRAKRRSARRSSVHGHCPAVELGVLEVLEPRQMLTSLVAVGVSGNSINLTDVSNFRSSGDDFAITYTSSQVVLTGTGGTSFKVGSQTLSSYTISITGPASFSMNLNRRGNSVSITGDGTASLGSVNVKLGTGLDDNSLTLTNVIASSVSVKGGLHNDRVTLDHCTINGSLSVNLGNQSGDSLTIAATTVTGNVSDTVSQLNIDHSTIQGNLSNTEKRKNSSFTSTDSTYNGAVAINMGRNSAVNLLGSIDGPNHFKSAVSFEGVRHRDIQINQRQNSVTYDVTPHYRHAGVVVPKTTITAPTATSASVATATPKITGTYDSVRGPNLSVNVNGTTYTLGTNSNLTTPTTGTWSLDLAGKPLTAKTNTVTVTSSNSQGDFATGTGTITNEQAIISSYLTANNLTATKTASGLNYVVTTTGTGAVPTAGKTVTANYSGFILNADGTKGTEFDSNVDSQFGHVSPFSFVLGAGNVIKGWDEAFALLPVGSVATLIIPSPLAYGTTGSGTKIPANTPLIFQVTVVSAT